MSSLTGEDFYVDVEPYTGFAFRSQVKMQLNIDVKPLSYDDPITGKTVTFGKNLPTMLYPLVQITDGGSAGKDDVALYNDSIRLAFDGRSVAYSVTSVIMAIFMALFIASATMVKKHYGSLRNPNRDLSMTNLIEDRQLNNGGNVVSNTTGGNVVPNGGTNAGQVGGQQDRRQILEPSEPGSETGQNRV